MPRPLITKPQPFALEPLRPQFFFFFPAYILASCQIGLSHKWIWPECLVLSNPCQKNCQISETWVLLSLFPLEKKMSGLAFDKETLDQVWPQCNFVPNGERGELYNSCRWKSSNGDHTCFALRISRVNLWHLVHCAEQSFSWKTRSFLSALNCQNGIQCSKVHVDVRQHPKGYKYQP